jgi:hypothetical protein
MPFMDRDSFIALLDRLGDPDDAKALAAGREIHQRMTAANLRWSDLLLTEEGEAGDDGAVAGSQEPLDQPAAAGEIDGALIDRLLARSTLSDDTRQEIEGLREDIASGAFSARDRKYLQDLEARLSR